MKKTDTLPPEYPSESTRLELSHEYQQDKVKMAFKNLCVLVYLDESSLSIGIE